MSRCGTDLALEMPIAMVTYDSSGWPCRTRLTDPPRARARGMHPRSTGVFAPRWLVAGPAAAMLAVTAMGCGSKAEQSTYDPIALGMLSNGPAFYDDGDVQIYEVRRSVSLPIVTPTEAQRASLVTPVPPYERTPWITKNDVKVQVTWTLSNLDGPTQPHNIEILLDPWNEFARYVPAVSVGEEEVVPDLSGIDLLLRVEGNQRKTGTFTFDDMDEVATDLATVENILVLNPPAAGPAMPGAGPNVNGMINHAFDIHNRSGDTDPLIQGFIPPKIAGLVGFDLGLRLYEKGTVAIEIVVEVKDLGGSRVIVDAPIKIDGTMWMTPDATISAPMAMVR